MIRYRPMFKKLKEYLGFGASSPDQTTLNFRARAACLIAAQRAFIPQQFTALQKISVIKEYYDTRARDRYREKMRDDGWRLWQYELPYAHEVVEIHRFGWDAPVTLKPHEANPEMNIAGLWWRLPAPMIDVTPIAHVDDG